MRDKIKTRMKVTKTVAEAFELKKRGAAEISCGLNGKEVYSFSHRKEVIGVKKEMHIAAAQENPPPLSLPLLPQLQ